MKHRLIQIALVLVVSLTLAAGVLSITACSGEAPRTPDENVRLEQLDADIERDTTSLEAYESDAKGLAEQLTDSDPANDAAAVAGLQSIETRYVEIADRVQANLYERGKLLNEATSRATAPLTGIAALLPPPWNALAVPILALGSGLAFKRSRSHLADAAMSVLRGKGLEAIRYFLKAYGQVSTEGQDRAAPIAAEKLGVPLPPDP